MYRSAWQIVGFRKFVVQLFWYLDVVGMILLIAILALILIPFTLAHGSAEDWKTAKILAPLIVGVCCIPPWVYWEKNCQYPMVPFRVGGLLSWLRALLTSFSCSKIALCGVPLESQ